MSGIESNQKDIAQRIDLNTGPNSDLKKLKVCMDLKEKLSNDMANSNNIDTFLNIFTAGKNPRRYLGYNWLYASANAQRIKATILKKIPNYYEIDKLLEEAKDIISLLPPNTDIPIEQITIKNKLTKDQAKKIYDDAVAKWNEITSSVSFWN